jgi:eukaryotic-like serine/threonine-protein kinase
MGTVYQATDTTLGRPVALKLLRPEMLEDSGAMARFEREARTLASLNHAHIASIFSFEEHNGVRFLALEYVPGPTLAERLNRGPLVLREAISVGKQIAEALEAAHAKGIMHRDLKPANVKVSEQGQVKVLDFGLAKTMQRPLATGPEANTATIEQNLTRAMTVIGTPAYMSPEQARGEELDARTDIWSFGCVFYELLTAKAAFSGKTVTDVLAAVVEREPNWAALPAGTPVPLLALLKRCLRKDRNQRLHDMADARLELEDLLAEPAQEGSGAGQPAVTRRMAIATLSGAAAGAAATGVFAISRYRGAVPRNLTRFAFEIPGTKFHNVSFNRRVAISPDGAQVVFNTADRDGSTAAFVRSLDTLETKLFKDAPQMAAPFLSPDSRSIGFYVASGTLRKIALSGGASESLCATDNSFSGGCWSDAGMIYYTEFPGGVIGIPAMGGEPKEIVKIDFEKGDRQHRYPYALPGGKLLFTTATADSTTFDDAQITAFDIDSGRRKVLVEGGTQPCFSPSGHLLYARDAKVLAVRFDPGSLEVSGQPFPVLEGVLMSRNTGAANFDVSASGDLVYTAGICDGGARTLVWVDRNGQAEMVPLPARSYLHPRFSPDDRRLAIEIEGPSHDLHVYDFDRGVMANLTTDGVSHWPVWSPDGRKLGYRSGPMGKFQLWQVPADRSRPPAKVAALGVAQSAESWSPDGQTIAYTATSPGVPAKIMVAYAEGGHEAEEFAGGKAPIGSSKFSPDGRWMAYCSNESGKPQVYVQAFPGPGAKIQISNDGGTDPTWKRNGGELYYRNGDSMMAVIVSTASGFNAGRPQELWKGHYSHGMSSSCGTPGATSSNYDVTADGKRFLMIKDDDQDRATSRQIVVVQGWADELRRLSAKA